MSRFDSKMLKMTFRRLFSVILCISLILPYVSGMTVTVFAANGVWKGSGTEEDPYLIEDLADLEKLASSVNSRNDHEGEYFQMTADIDMSEKYSESTGLSWRPIGGITNAEDKDCAKFKGVFDGNGHVVRNIYVNAQGSYCVGLFGDISYPAVIKNLGIEGGSVTGKNRVGSITGGSSGTIINCYNTCSVTAYYTDARANKAGGIVGGNTVGIVENCYNTGSVTTKGSIAGGIAAYEGDVRNCYNIGTVSSSTGYDEAIGGVAGTGGVEDSYYLDSCGGTGDGTPITADKFSDISTFEDWDFSSTWLFSPILLRPVLRSVPEGGDGTKEHPYLISNLAQLEAFRNYINGGGGTGEYFKLMADIDLSEAYGADYGTSWTPIGNSETPFGGYFDGNNHEIQNIYILSPDECQGLFGCLTGSIENLTVNGGFVRGELFVGGIVGNNRGKITNCYNSASICVNNFDGGGIAGINNGSITLCMNSGTISGSNDTGGITGFNWAMVTKCYNIASITADIQGSGGIAGRNGGTVSDCYSIGTVKGESLFGGITGDNFEAGTTDNNYYSTDNNPDSAVLAGVNGKLLETFSTGEVAYLLNGGSITSAVDAVTDGTQVWYQTFPDDTYPKFSGGTVYGRKTYPCVHNANTPTVVEFFNSDRDDIYQYDNAYSINAGNKAQIIESCEGCNHHETATLMVADVVYDKSEKKTAVISYSDNWRGDKTAEIIYNGDLVNVGTVTAEITINEKTANATFNITQATNEFTQKLSIENWNYGETAKTPVAEAMYGDVEFSYSATENGTFTSEVPDTAGVWYVKATVEGTTNYTGLTDVVSFEINKTKVEKPTSKYYQLFTYNGQEQTYVLPTSNLYTISGNKQTDAGNHTVTITLNDTDNYEWESGNEIETCTFYISPKNISVQWSGETEFTYDGNPHKPEASTNDFIAGDDVWLEVIGEEIDANTGSELYLPYHASLKLAGSDADNYNLIELGFVEFDIHPKEIDIEWLNTSLIYNGTAQKPNAVATGVVSGDSISLTVSGAQTNASVEEYTATVTGITGEDAGNYKLPGNVTEEFTISKADPVIGTVSVSGAVKDSTEPSAVVLVKEKGPDGTLEITDSAMLVNKDEYNWKFTPDDTDNYNSITGTVKIDVVETIAPTVSITVGEKKWELFHKNIIFDLFFNETQNVAITYADEEGDSGLKDTLYFVSDKELTVDELANIEWKSYTNTFNVNPDASVVIYAKATDNDGNSTIVNSDGIVLDATPPVISGITNGGIYYGDTVVTISDELAGIKEVTVDGNPVELSEDSFTIAADNAEHTIVATDNIGNEIVYQVQVYKIYTVKLPDEQVGYTLTISETELEWNGSATLTFNLADGYSKTSTFAVTATNATLNDNEDGTYTISDVTDNVIVSVVGVEKAAAPSIEEINNDGTDYGDVTLEVSNEPETSDNSNIGFCFTMLTLVLIGIVITTISDRKRNHKEKI